MVTMYFEQFNTLYGILFHIFTFTCPLITSRYLSVFSLNLFRCFFMPSLIPLISLVLFFVQCFIHSLSLVSLVVQLLLFGALGCPWILIIQVFLHCYLHIWFQVWWQDCAMVHLSTMDIAH
jgi:hypothetical protein